MCTGIYTCVRVPVCGCDCVCGFGLRIDIHENGCCVQDVNMYACPPADMSGYVCMCVCVGAHVRGGI